LVATLPIATPDWFSGERKNPPALGEDNVAVLERIKE
jgi:hypothetical protein